VALSVDEHRDFARRVRIIRQQRGQEKAAA